MSENEMDYRGSKSNFLSKFVKEQRVDGSCFGIQPKLRYTLMGGASYYRIRIPSNQLNVKNFSTINYSSITHPLEWDVNP